MNPISIILFLITIILEVQEGITRPRECYTCQSTLDSQVCGEGFAFPFFMQKYCTVNQYYCLKVIEKAGRSPLVYRKCSQYNCEQEIAQRDGEILACSTCTSSLCNVSTVSSSISSLIYFLIIAFVFYHLNILTLHDQS